MVKHIDQIPGGFESLRGMLPTEVDSPDLLRLMGTTPVQSQRKLQGWGISPEQQAVIFSGDLSGISMGLRRDIVAAEVVIAGGENPRLHGVLTEAARTIILDAQTD